MRFFIYTLGCKINQYESQSLRESWLDRGFEEARTPDLADVVFVHTCAVTAGAVADSRACVRRAGRAAPDAAIVVAGCASQVEPHTFAALPGVKRVVGQSDKAGLADGLEDIQSDGPGEGEPCTLSPPGENAGPSVHARSPLLALQPQAPSPQPRLQRPGATWPDFSVRGSNRARPVLKVQDGCSHGCTYCIVPRTRGGARSRPFAEIAAEARRLLDSGHREIVLAGINLGQYTLDRKPGDFWDLLVLLEETLAPEWSGRARIRLSSLDPGMLTDKAVAALAASGQGAKMVCEHLHLSLQSADTAVLAAMGRSHYSASGVLAFLERMGRHWPAFALGADILTGFPGESEAAFAATQHFCRQAPLTYAHVFAYSKRPGTAAAKAADQVDPKIKKSRAKTLRDMVQDKENAFLARLAKEPRLTVAPERLDPWTGVCQYYVECRMHAPASQGRELTTVRPVGVSGAALMVEEV